ncbi:MAG: hypothetical protein WA828_11975 [Coleofasciculaceae cyanobacterium]
MTRFVHDQFAKQYLEELLTPLGKVETSRDVPGEVRQIDVWFAPTPQPETDPQILGLLGRFAAGSCVLEPFRNTPTATEVRSCLVKLFELQAGLQRKAKRDEQRIQEADLPRLWILAPTASTGLLEGFRARLDQENWGEGVYFFGEFLRTAIVAIHQLPRTEETLWLRILGKGTTQRQAIEELMALPREQPLRSNALDLLASLRVNLEASDNLNQEDREVIMNLSPIYLQRLEAAAREGRQEGRQEGVQAERRATIENLLRVRFGLDEVLAAVVEPLLELPPEEFTLLLLQLSREELLARFGG